MWWQLQWGWIFLASHIVNMVYFYSYSQIVHEDSLAFMIVSVTKVSHCSEHILINTWLETTAWACTICLFAATVGEGGREPHCIVPRLDDFSNCPGGYIWVKHKRVRTSSEAKRNLPSRSWKTEQLSESDLKLICPDIHAVTFCLHSLNCKMSHLILPVPTDCFCMSSPSGLHHSLAREPTPEGGWRAPDQQIPAHLPLWTRVIRGPLLS